MKALKNNFKIDLTKLDLSNNIHYKNNKAEFIQIIDIINEFGTYYFWNISKKKNGHLFDFLSNLNSSNEFKKLQLKTKILWMLEGWTVFPLCKLCKKKIIRDAENFHSTKGFNYCCEEHAHHDQENRIRAGKSRRAHCNADPQFASEIRRKREATNIRKIGYKSNFQDPTFIEQSLEKKKKKYGNGNNFEAIKKTNRLTYGTDFAFINPIVHQKCIDSMLRNHGVPYAMQDPKVKAKFDFKAINLKGNQTKRKNHTFTKSVPEELAYQMLKFIFPKLQRQYYSNEYPFDADFYDPDQPNVRFEYNGTWIHGGHPFNENSYNDLVQVMKMASKESGYYRSALKGWIVRDPMKREVAKKNGIDLVEFWNLDEVRYFVMHFFDKKARN